MSYLSDFYSVLILSQKYKNVNMLGGNCMTYNITAPKFTGRNVPLTEIAQATGKSAQYLRIGLQRGILKFGFAFKNDGSSEYSYYCPDKKVWEELGYFSDKTTTGTEGD